MSDKEIHLKSGLNQLAEALCILVELFLTLEHSVLRHLPLSVRTHISYHMIGKMQHMMQLWHIMR